MVLGFMEIDLIELLNIHSADLGKTFKRKSLFIFESCPITDKSYFWSSLKLRKGQNNNNFSRKHKTSIFEAKYKKKLTGAKGIVIKSFNYPVS